MQGFFFICEYLEITPQEFFNDELSNPIKYNNLLCDLEELDSEQLDIVGAVVKGLKKNNSRTCIHIEQVRPFLFHPHILLSPVSVSLNLINSPG